MTVSRACREYVLGYVEVRSEVSSQHKLPTREEIAGISYGMFKPHALLAALDELVAEDKIKTEGPYYGTTIPEAM